MNSKTPACVFFVGFLAELTSNVQGDSISRSVSRASADGGMMTNTYELIDDTK